MNSEKATYEISFDSCQKVQGGTGNNVNYYNTTNQSFIRCVMCLNTFVAYPVALKRGKRTY